jgi:hypothetical protein
MTVYMLTVTMIHVHCTKIYQTLGIYTKVSPRGTLIATKISAPGINNLMNEPGTDKIEMIILVTASVLVAGLILEIVLNGCEITFKIINYFLENFHE